MESSFLTPYLTTVFISVECIKRLQEVSVIGHWSLQMQDSEREP